MKSASGGLSILVLSCACAGPVHAQGDVPAFDFDEPAQPGPAMQLWATHYYVHRAAAVPTGVAFPDAKGKPLSDKVSARDWCLAAIEGTVQTTRGGELVTLNYGGRGTDAHVDCAATLNISPGRKPWITSTGKSWFSPAKGPYGDGVQGYRLVPLRTIAVDRKVIPFGSVLFVKSARGLEVKLPGGETVRHDGYFFAADTGGAIKGNHIDVFCGAGSVNCLPALVTSDQDRTFEATLVTDEAIVAKLKALHRP